MAARNHVDLALKTLSVLEALAVSEFGKPLKEIAREVGLVKSSAFRILFTLKEAGYVEQPESNGVYRLTLKSAALSRRNTKRLGLATIARPHLNSLRNQLDESVALVEHLANSVILIDVLDTSHPLRLSLHIGDDCPIHATAQGKAVAAFLSAKDLDSFLESSKLTQFTEHTLTGRLDLELELERTRKAGYSINDEETVTGAFIVGAPIFDSQSSVCDSVSVNTPTARCSVAQKKHLIASIIETGKRISTDLAAVGFVH